MSEACRVETHEKLETVPKEKCEPPSCGTLAGLMMEVVSKRFHSKVVN